MRHFRLTRLLVIAVLVLVPVDLARADAPSTQPASRTVVVWISVDGLRGDYAERAQAPLLMRLMKEGAYSRQLVPVFPSLTFPSHAGQVTGATPDENGITGNVFYDSRSHQSYNMPDDSSLLQAEPIWLTAARQGIRTAVLDWPLAYAQKGVGHADYYSPGFDRNLNDPQRLARLLDTWRNDKSDRPLQLLLGYIGGMDGPGHRYGPDAPEMLGEMRRVDGELQRFFEGAIDLFKQRMGPTDRLYLIITGDHGMYPVHTLVNIHELLPGDLPPQVRVVDNSTIVHVFLDEVQQDRDGVATRIPDALKQYDFVRAYRREDLPAEWHLAHPTRTGDIVVTVKPGYSFSRKILSTTAPAEGADVPHGMHGYWAAECPQVMSMLIVWRYPQPLDGIDLGKVDALQLHPTVAALLGIQPSDKARAKPITLPGATSHSPEPQRPSRP